MVKDLASIRQMQFQSIAAFKNYTVLLKGILAALFLSGSAHAGMLDFNYYPYRSNTTWDKWAAMNAAHNFGSGLSFFGLLNLGDIGPKNVYYSESNFRWAPDKNLPLELTVQLNFRSGKQNDRYRLGVRWHLSRTKAFKPFFEALNLAYAVNLHAVQFDHEDPYVWQLEHTFNMKFPAISDRLYLGGFWDQTFNQNLPAGFPARPIIGKAQLGYRIVDNFFAVADFRVNEYRRSDVMTLGLGVQYKFLW